jgi:N-acetylmuramoyl-L-alanine amidase
MSRQPTLPGLSQSPSPNFDTRSAAISLLVLHYTGMATAQEALLRLQDPQAKVSCHYVVLEGGQIIQLVAEDKRAWHAGVAHWRGISDVNSASIGIEIVNGGHDFGLPPYPAQQMARVAALAQDICARYAIAPGNVVGHSDVAPLRKADPGEHFDWRYLAALGVGQPIPDVLSPDVEISAALPALRLGMQSAAVAALCQALIAYGYTSLTKTNRYDAQLEAVVRAFQRHWRPALCDGVADAHTQALAHALAASLQE